MPIYRRLRYCSARYVPPIAHVGGAHACLDCGRPQRWLPDESCLMASGLRGLALAAHQIVMLCGLAKHLLHVFGQQIAGLY